MVLGSMTGWLFWFGLMVGCRRFAVGLGDGFAQGLCWAGYATGALPFFGVPYLRSPMPQVPHVRSVDSALASALILSPGLGRNPPGSVGQSGSRPYLCRRGGVHCSVVSAPPLLG